MGITSGVLSQKFPNYPPIVSHDLTALNRTHSDTLCTIDSLAKPD